MRVSAKTEYACLAMFELAANYANGLPVRVQSLADAHDLKQRFLVQILLQLKGAGLVVSVRGKDGGYLLARPPDEIALAHIINATDRTAMRPVKVAARSPAGQALTAVWREIQEAEQRVLQSATLADLLRRTQHGTTLSYQI